MRGTHPTVPSTFIRWVARPNLFERAPETCQPPLEDTVKLSLTVAPMPNALPKHPPFQDGRRTTRGWKGSFPHGFGDASWDAPCGAGDRTEVWTTTLCLSIISLM